MVEAVQRRRDVRRGRELAADLPRPVLRGVDVDVRVSALDRGDDRLRDVARSRERALARSAQRQDDRPR